MVPPDSGPGDRVGIEADPTAGERLSLLPPAQGMALAAWKSASVTASFLPWQLLAEGQASG